MIRDSSFTLVIIDVIAGCILNAIMGGIIGVMPGMGAKKGQPV